MENLKSRIFINLALTPENGKFVPADFPTFGAPDRPRRSRHVVALEHFPNGVLTQVQAALCIVKHFAKCSKCERRR